MKKRHLFFHVLITRFSTFWIYLRPLWSAACLREQEEESITEQQTVTEVGKTEEKWSRGLVEKQCNAIKTNDCQLVQTGTSLTVEPLLVRSYWSTLLQWCKRNLGPFHTCGLVKNTRSCWLSISSSPVSVQTAFTNEVRHADMMSRGQTDNSFTGQFWLFSSFIGAMWTFTPGTDGKW